MDKRYAMQIIESNDRDKKYLELSADWILSIKNDCELGKQIKKKMLDKIKALDEYTEKLKKEL